ncbi:CapA family protein [Alteribacter populi]|uniref:CapA family protein n=1 Tax=Alteribacter populi TaxID=2011011 RepID=UPI000BBB43CA|nr:CapA family protein [Alteribacter populi]
MTNHTFKDRMRAWVQLHRKKATFHTIIALVIVSAIMFTEPIWGKVDVPENTRADNVEHRISMVGDMMFGRHVHDAAVRSGEDISRVFDYAKPFFDESDYVTGNLESPIMDAEDESIEEEMEMHEYPGKFIYLYSYPGTELALQSAGFDSVSLANNHTMDYRVLSLDETFRHMANVDVDIVGMGHGLGIADSLSEEQIAEANGEITDTPAQEEEELYDAARISYHDLDDNTKIALIGITDVFYSGFRAEQYADGVFTTGSASSFSLLRSRLREARENADIVMVHVHWGDEYQVGYNSSQEDLAYLMANNGADVIIGHHSHVLEPVQVINGVIQEDGKEIPNNTLVMYGLGNFIFDQGWSRTKETTIAQLDLLTDGSHELSFIPMSLLDSKPRETHGLLKPYRDYRIFRTLKKELDQELWRVEDGRLILDLDTAGIFERNDENL